MKRRFQKPNSAVAKGSLLASGGACPVRNAGCVSNLPPAWVAPLAAYALLVAGQPTLSQDVQPSTPGLAPVADISGAAVSDDKIGEYKVITRDGNSRLCQTILFKTNGTDVIAITNSYTEDRKSVV